MKNVLVGDNLTAGYSGRTVLYDINLRIGVGERVLLIGPNGSGKTTLLKLLVGQLHPSVGTISLNGVDVTGIPMHRRVALGIGYLPQTRNVFPSLSVEDNLQLASSFANANYEQLRRRALDVFPGLKTELGRRAGLLSGGGRQALAIAMVLMRPIQLLLLDEPSASLAPKAATEILAALREVQAGAGFAVLMVEHNVRLAREWLSRAVIMSQGRIVDDRDNPGTLTHDQLLPHYFRTKPPCPGAS